MKVAQKAQKGVNPIPLQYTVKPFLSFIKFIQYIKKATGLQNTTLELFLAISYKHYTNGKGCTVTYLVSTLYNSNGTSLRRSINYRLDTLLGKGLVYSVPMKGRICYYLSDKAKGILEEVNQAKSK